jgi:hypothetical protein
MIIGYFGKYKEMEWFARGLEALGNEIIRISGDLPNTEYSENPPDLIIPREHFPRDFFNPIKLTDLYHLGDIDVIFYQPLLDLTLDWVNVNVPIVYYLHEMVYRRWLYSSGAPVNPIALCYACHDIIPMYEASFGFEMKDIPSNHCLFLPYAWEPSLYLLKAYRNYWSKEELDKVKQELQEGKSIHLTPHQDAQLPLHQKYSFGFMGTVGQDNSSNWMCETDPIAEHIRDWRGRFVKYASQNCGCHVKQKESDHDYIEYLSQCNLFLNVSSNYGYVNQRMFHVPGAGCVLVQNRYPGIDQIGLEDNENCLLYSSEEEMLCKIRWARVHPTELEEIRENGIKWAQQHTYQRRAEQLYQRLQEWIT